MIKKSMYTSPFGNAGWHSNNRDKLIEDVKQFCTHHDYDGFVSALISPHAGYKYCGHICGHAFGATKHQSFEHIIIIGPSHHEYLKNRYCIPSAIEMTTEIGSSSINKSFLSKFKNDAIIPNFNRINIINFLWWGKYRNIDCYFIKFIDC